MRYDWTDSRIPFFITLFCIFGGVYLGLYLAPILFGALQ